MLKTFLASFGEINEGFRLCWRSSARPALLFFLLAAVLVPIVPFWLDAAAGQRHDWVGLALIVILFGLAASAKCRQAYHIVKFNDHDAAEQAGQIVDWFCFAALVALLGAP